MIVRPKSEPRSGAATVELAVLLPFLLFVCVITTDWARLLYYTISAEACARNGAMYASDGDAAARSPYTTTGDAAMNECPSLIAGTTATRTTSGTTTVSTYTLPSGEVKATVTKTLTTDSTGAAAVVVTVDVPFKSITTYPGVTTPSSVTRSVEMRVLPMLTR